MERYSNPREEACGSELLDLKAVSRMTGVPVNTLRHYRATGKGPKMFKLGGRVVAFASDVEAWVRSNYDDSSRGGS